MLFSSIALSIPLAFQVDRAGTQARFINRSNFRSLEIIAPLEQTLRKLVAGSRSGSARKMLRLLGERRRDLRSGRPQRDA